MKLLATHDLEAQKLKKIEDEMAQKRALAELEVAERLEQQKIKLKEIEEIEWQKLKQLDDEVERKRVATEAFVNQVCCYCLFVTKLL